MGPQVWAALVSGSAVALVAALKYALDRRARTHEDLWSRRLEVYREIWAASAYFSRWPEQEPTLADVAALQRKLRLWYYGDGGILMSVKARRRYGYVQRGLDAIAHGRPANDDKVSAEDYLEMAEVFSRFRSALTDDLESRRKRSVVYSLVELTEEYRVREELELRHRKMLQRHGRSLPPADRERGITEVVGRSLWEVLVIAIGVVGTVAVMLATSGPDDPDAATVTLAAAVMAVAGTSLGHTRGRRDAQFGTKPSVRVLPHTMLILGLFVAVAGASVLVHALLPDGSAVAEDAAAALCATVLGIVGTVVANEVFLHSSTHILVGVALLAGSLTWGVVAIVQASGTSPADSDVAYAAAAIGIAGTLLGHATGRRYPHRI